MIRIDDNHVSTNTLKKSNKIIPADKSPSKATNTGKTNVVSGDGSAKAKGKDASQQYSQNTNNADVFILTAQNTASIV